MPYSVCGCLPPSAVKATLPGAGIFSKKGKGRAASNKEIANVRSELISAAEMHAEETHPSEHNAVAIINPPLPSVANRQMNQEGQPAAQAQVRRGKAEKRMKDVAKLAKWGMLDDWTELQHKRREASGLTHPHSFLCPVQFGAKDPLGPHGFVFLALLIETQL